MMPEPLPDTPSARVIFDMKLPLWGIVSAAAAGFICFASMYFSVQALTDAVHELQITVKSGNNSISIVIAENALLKFRTSTNEADIVQLKAEVARLSDFVRGLPARPGK